jgi:hypothetical protein
VISRVVDATKIEPEDPEDGYLKIFPFRSRKNVLEPSRFEYVGITIWAGESTPTLEEIDCTSPDVRMVFSPAGRQYKVVAAVRFVSSPVVGTQDLNEKQGPGLDCSDWLRLLKSQDLAGSVTTVGNVDRLKIVLM